MKKMYFLCMLSTAFLVILATENSAYAQEKEKLLRKEADLDPSFSIAFENDIFTGEDNGYTNGVRIAWLSPESDIPWWMEHSMNKLPFFAQEGHKRYGFAAGQTMHAPDDLTRKELISDDRPYAGLLFASAGLISDTGYRLDNLQLTLGVVGPSSLAAQTQDAVHKITDSPDPQGWDNQLRDEPVVMLTYERKWRSIYQFSPFGFAVDVTPQMGGSIGNLHSYASTGAVFRLGYDLPADYGPPLIRPALPGSDFFSPSKPFGWYLFSGFEGRAVAHNIFLDGNTFRDSHHVDKEILVGSIQLGAAMTLGKDVRIAYTHLWRSREFEQQQRADKYGAVTVSFRF